MAENINIAGRLHSTATGNVVAGANEIYDDAKGKKQSVVNQETDAALDDRYTKSQTYNKTELNNLITTPNQEYVSVTATDQTTEATDVLPATGAANTVYRVGNWDGSQFDASVYSEYAWNGSQYIHLSTKIQIGEVFDISAYHATGGTLATYSDLNDALNGTNGGVPQSLQKGGMSVKFVHTSDNKYVQYRLTAKVWTTDVTQWQIQESETINVITLEGVVGTTKTYTIDSSKQYKQGDIIAIKFVPISTASSNRITFYYGDWSDMVSYSLFGQWLIVTFTKNSNGFIVSITGGQMVTSGSFDFYYYNGKNLTLFATKEEEKLNENLKVNVNSVNLVNPDTLLSGYGLDSSGRMYKSDGLYLSDYIPVSAEGVTTNGQSIAIFSKDRMFLRQVNNIYTYIDGDAYIRITFNTFEHTDFKANYGTVLLPYTPFNPIIGYLESFLADIARNRQNIETLSEQVEKSNIDITSTIDVATGKKNESCIVDNLSDEYVRYETQAKFDVRKKQGRNVVAVNHDDCASSDIVGTRKIYNKYGFNSNFNYILVPFGSVSEKELYVTNLKKMVAEGHDIGLHAIIKSSFWMVNALYDAPPIPTTRIFVPTLSELQTVDSSGKNIFGYTVSATTKFSQIGFGDVPSSIDKYVLSANNDDYSEILMLYTWYTREDSITGLDLNDEIVSKSELTWLEYWYNELIDNTLGYSKIGGGRTLKYTNDYAVPEGASAYQYYPDAEHLQNGKMVFFDDTDNPHYNDTDYQKVGRFTKGLFKGCASCCNYEVIDRILAIFKAFMKHYYEIDDVTSFSVHGRRYVTCFYKYNNLQYQDRSHQVLIFNQSRFFMSRLNRFITFKELLLNEGIKMTNHGIPHPSSALEGEIGLYEGQRGIRSPYFNGNDKSTMINYLELFGTDGVAQEDMNYQTFLSYMPSEQKDWMKWAYENAGKLISNGETTKRMYSYFADLINTIRSCDCTGKIPVLSVDTIKHNAAQMCAIELACQYCYANDIELVPMEKAREIANSCSRSLLNYFPNPQFSQKLLRMFGGTSESKMAYLPEGLQINFERNGDNNSFDVTNEIIETKEYRTLNIHTNGSAILLDAKMYGLPAGKYKVQFYAKKNIGSASVKLFIKKNSDFIEQYYNGAAEALFTHKFAFIPTTEWSLFEGEFEIAPPVVIPETTSPESVICEGYENNISNIVLRCSMDGQSGETDSILSIANPMVMPL